MFGALCAATEFLNVREHERERNPPCVKIEKKRDLVKIPPVFYVRLTRSRCVRRRVRWLS